MFEQRGGGALQPAACPFTATPGDLPPALTGREEVTSRLGVMLAQLEARRSASLLFVEGARGMGKTSLEVAARDEARARGITAVTVELGGATTVESVTGRLASAFGTTAGDQLARLRSVSAAGFGASWDPAGIESTGVASAVLAAAVSAQESDQPVLLLLDEIQDSPSIAAEVVRGLHIATQERLPMGAVYAGLPGSKARVVKEVSYAERYDGRVLAPLDPQATFDAISIPFADHGVDVSVDLAAPLAAATGGYPFFVQVWGVELWCAAENPDRIEQATFDRAAVLASARTDAFLSERWERIPSRRKAYLAAAAEQGDTAATGNIAARLGVTLQDLSPDRARLISDGLLNVPRPGQVAFAIPPMAAWIRGLRLEREPDASSEAKVVYRAQPAGTEGPVRSR